MELEKSDKGEDVLELEKGEDVLRAQGDIGETLLKTTSTDQPTFSSVGPYSPYIVSGPLYNSLQMSLVQTSLPTINTD